MIRCVLLSSYANFIKIFSQTVSNEFDVLLFHLFLGSMYSAANAIAGEDHLYPMSSPFLCANY